MLNLPILRRGEPYTSMDVDEVVHFATGEPIARVSRANGGMAVIARYEGFDAHANAVSDLREIVNGKMDKLG